MKYLKIFSKPLHVTWFRVKQHMNLLLFRYLGLWKTKEKQISTFIDLKECIKSTSNIVSDSYEETLRTINDEGNDIVSNNERTQSKILNGRVEIFGKFENLREPFNWNCDWRHNFIWENKLYHKYSFYERNKTTPYDVKYPWELSRLAFLIPVAQQILVDYKEKNLKWIHSVLEDWIDKNPLAYSVNWYPMEVSIRTINLIKLREVLIIASKQNHEIDNTISLVNELLLLHGVFLWRNIEYTDVRGNHYSANLCALLLLGTTFREFYKEANSWLNYARQKIEREFDLQFLEDGVNIEKSLPYHRLVVELFLLSFVCMTRNGVEISETSKRKLLASCQFVRDYTKPDGLSSIIGDNDSASIFLYDGLHLNNHENLLYLASLFLNEKLLPVKSSLKLSAAIMFGDYALQTERPEYMGNEDIEHHQYDKGGFYIKKNKHNFFIQDLGEVGMLGRGGHGHNDLFSFELFLEGEDLIVDSGCSTYTGDLKKKNFMRSTQSHNGLSVDNFEIAELTGDWAIKNDAVPTEVSMRTDLGSSTYVGTNEGYCRLDDPVIHTRSIKIEDDFSVILCEDHLQCQEKHSIKRFLHFNTEVDITKEGKKIHLTTQANKKYILEYDEETDSEVDSYTQSILYGQEGIAKKITFITRIEKETHLFYKISKA